LIGPSATACRVAAYRLSFIRVSLPYGDPGADEALARDVAGGTVVSAGDAMIRYLRARTTFFDQAVVDAIERGISQLVSIGSGYDGRALRYSTPGVRWWEVDRSGTQLDKLARLARLHIDVTGVGFVAHDLDDPGLAAALVSARYQTAEDGFFLCEGVAVYLEDRVLTASLTELRSVASPGTRLALSLGTTESSSWRRARFEGTVARLGEPARSSFRGESAIALLAATGWGVVPTSARAERAGFVIAAPT
jgi:methyltransferase (TIGR00027 family)